MLSRTFGQESDLLKVLGTVFVDLGAVATGDLHGRHRKGPRPSGTGGKPQPARAPKATIVRGENPNPVVKITRNYKELPGITRNYQKLPEAAVYLSGKNDPS